MLIVGNPKSIHTIRLSRFFEENYQVNLIDEGIDFSFRNFFSALRQTKTILSKISPDILVLYQLNLTAFVATLANKKTKSRGFRL